MKKLIPFLIALVALAIGALFVTPDVATETTASLVTKLVLVTILALQVVPMCSHKMGLIDTSTVSNTIQPQYSKKLLEHAVPLTRLVDYATLEELPANIGATSIRFFRPPSADLSATGAPVQLTEGVAPTNDRDLSFTPVDATLIQIGQKGRVTDVATNVGLVKFLDSVITLFGEEFALDVDTRLRNMLCHASTGLTKRYAQGAANFATLQAASLANGCMLPRDFLDAMTRLKLNRAPTMQGHYVAIVPPQVSRDILNNSDWQDVVQTAYADKIFKGEIGDLFGLRIVEGTNPFQEDETEGTYATSFSSGGSNTTGLIYSTIVTGKGAYGTVNMKKMGASPHKPQIIIVSTADKTDPLNQYTSVGWKAFWTGVVLNSAWGVTLRSKSQFVA
jgi:N4-gp56 family major capsid protein